MPPRKQRAQSPPDLNLGDISRRRPEPDQYEVLATIARDKDGKLVERGARIELTNEQAERYIRLGCVKRVS